jgi:lipid II:glycine glycyltransferase (peptidoglycan interpeptide bridge formation enzyme)
LSYLLEQTYFISDSLPWTEALKSFEYSDIHHTFEYANLDAERIGGTANFILVNTPSGVVGLPIIFRKIPNESRYIDAISVYGYNGVLTSPSITSEDFLSAVSKIKDGLVQRNCVSFFNRESNFTKHRLPDSMETGKVLAVDLTQTPEDYKKSLAEGHRQEIKALRNLNYEVIKSKDPKVIQDFNHVYEHTMLRRGAKINYFFGLNYFDSLLKINSAVPDLRVVYREGKMAAGAIFITQGDYIYYIFSGSILGVTHYPAMKLILDQVIQENLNNGKKLLHLGGGLGGKQDTLYQFKFGFGKIVLPFYTTQWILIPEVYNRLSAQSSPQSNFFPRYRVD